MKLFSYALFIVFVSCAQAFSLDDLVKFLDTAYIVLDGITKIIKLPASSGKNVSELAVLYGYPLEIHNVTTDDEYKLNIFRIPYGRNENKLKNATKPVALLMHGLFSSGVDWINLGPENSLGFALADAGYDVWLGNARNTKYSRAHTTLDPDKNSSFWDFSWHEQGVYDLPAMIDYILKKTGVSKISYVGHSEGSTVFFVMGSEKPEYNDKISMAVLLAPVAYMTNLSSPIPILLDQYLDILIPAFDLLGIHEVPPTRWSRIIGQIVCNDESGMQKMCVLGTGYLCGFDFKEVNGSLFPTILTNFPAGISTKQLIHYGQEIKSGHFRQYDFGFSNILKYGTIEPPDYNIEAVTARIALFYSNNDLLSAAYNVKQLAAQLPNVVSNILMPYEFWNHFDYMWGNDAKAMLYDQIVELFDKYKS